MIDERDMQLVLESWLAEGPARMPDRVAGVVGTRIARQRQRPGWWSVPAIGPVDGRLALVAALTVAIMAAVASVLIGQPRPVVRPSIAPALVAGPSETPNESASPTASPPPATPAPWPTGYLTQFVVPTTIVVGQYPRDSMEFDTKSYIRFRPWSYFGPMISIGRPYGFADAAAVLLFFKEHASDHCPGMAHPVTATLGRLGGRAFLCAPPESDSNYDHIAFYPWSKAGRDAGSNHAFDELTDWYTATGKRGGGPAVLIFVTDIRGTPVVISLEDLFPGKHYLAGPVFPPDAHRPVDLLAFVPPDDRAFLESVQVGD
jgi:hypothetical protein